MYFKRFHQASLTIINNILMQIYTYTFIHLYTYLHICLAHLHIYIHTYACTYSLGLSLKPCLSKVISVCIRAMYWCNYIPCLFSKCLPELLWNYICHCWANTQSSRRPKRPPWSQLRVGFIHSLQLYITTSRYQCRLEEDFSIHIFLCCRIFTLSVFIFYAILLMYSVTYIHLNLKSSI